MYYNKQAYNPSGDRFFPFFFPVGALLLGGLGGAAIASAARPRPVYAAPYPAAYPPRPYGYNYYNSYNYY